MQINVFLFATLKDLAGQSRLTLNVPGDNTTVEGVRRTLTAMHPHLEANLNAAIAAVNEEYAFATDPVKDGDQVAFFPPVSGGAAENDSQPEVFLLADQPVDLDDLLTQITTPATGALCVFSGVVRGATVRDNGGLRQTQHLQYEAYQPMALAKMQQVAAEIRSQWPLVQGIAIMQRIGTLEVGQNTVLIACSSGHRDEGCFEAARYGIDRLKEIVPVWKKEIGADGAAWVEGHYLPTEGDKRH